MQMAKQYLRKFRVTYETGNPDWGNVVRRQADTMAVSMANALSNVWYRTGRDETFFVVRAEEVETA